MHAEWQKTPTLYVPKGACPGPAAGDKMVMQKHKYRPDFIIDIF
jgi:hypothetical protein